MGTHRPQRDNELRSTGKVQDLARRSRFKKKCFRAPSSFHRYGRPFSAPGPSPVPFLSPFITSPANTIDISLVHFVTCLIPTCGSITPASDAWLPAGLTKVWTKVR